MCIETCNKGCIKEIEGALGFVPRKNWGSGCISGDLYRKSSRCDGNGSLRIGLSGLPEEVLPIMVNCTEYSRSR